MSLRLYNTLSRKPEELQPVHKGMVNFYTCGPTVYNFAHIGNLRSYIFADILYRTLKLNGYKVRWVMNITDVDDKTIRQAIAKYGEKAGLKELRKFTDLYTRGFMKDLDALNISRKEIKFVKVSDSIPEIKKFIKKLIKLGYAYKANDGVYFNIAKYQKDFGDYGELVGKGFLKGKKVGARVKVDEYEKENLSDFALWKARDKEDGNIFWKDKELGDGRPGWHIECSAINYGAFKGTTDIHTGGVDLIFPHHVNEIAQSQPLYRPFTKIWCHPEHLMVEGEKMSKSKGNLFTLTDLREKGFDPLALRYLMLGAGYKTKLNFTWESLTGAQKRLSDLWNKYSAVKKSKSAREDMDPLLGALNDNLDAPQALALLGKNVALLKELGLSPKKLPSLRNETESNIPAEIAELLSQREAARRNKQFMQADTLRDRIFELGYVIEDGADGPSLKHR